MSRQARSRLAGHDALRDHIVQNVVLPGLLAGTCALVLALVGRRLVAASRRQDSACPSPPQAAAGPAARRRRRKDAARERSTAAQQAGVADMPQLPAPAAAAALSDSAGDQAGDVTGDSEAGHTAHTGSATLLSTPSTPDSDQPAAAQGAAQPSLLAVHSQQAVLTGAEQTAEGILNASSAAGEQQAGPAAALAVATAGRIAPAADSGQQPEPPAQALSVRSSASAPDPAASEACSPAVHSASRAWHGAGTAVQPRSPAGQAGEAFSPAGAGDGEERELLAQLLRHLLPAEAPTAGAAPSSSAPTPPGQLPVSLPLQAEWQGAEAYWTAAAPRVGAAAAASGDAALDAPLLALGLDDCLPAQLAADAPLCLSAAAAEELFCCPITQEVMADPVVLADGFTYERAAIEEWLARHDTSPLTNQRLPHTRLLPNLCIRRAVALLQQ